MMELLEKPTRRAIAFPYIVAPTAHAGRAQLARLFPSILHHFLGSTQ
jgi:hypothetical protein